MRSKMTIDERVAYYADLRHRMETEYGMKYYTPPSATHRNIEEFENV
jgi:hypothetical protein